MTRIDTNWQYHGLRLVRIENEVLCIDVLPELGAKIYSFIYKPSDRNLLWHHPHILPARQPFGASFDDNWSGGWDELIPNDLPAKAPDGALLPDHGEIWSQPTYWEILTSSANRCEVRFIVHGRVLPTRFEKTICLENRDPFIRIMYSFTNLGTTPIDFLWNIHPALEVTPHTWLDVPAITGMTDPWREDRFQANRSFRWPYVISHNGEKADLRQIVPKESASADMHYLIDIEEGWYAATDRSSMTGFALTFQKSVFPHVWLFRALGGWRGLYTAILEPSTGFPYDLEAAKSKGTCGHLDEGKTIEAQVIATAYSGLSSIARVESDGRIVPG
ncbi:MAG: DUF5107 domain-containing protein [Spirochaetota bacterium]|nr:MAG: DUF5107 domain-containing protein [Spirochaetota bacterium]